MHLLTQDDQPRFEYIPESSKRARKRTRGPNKRIRPIPEQPANPFIRHIALTRGFIAIVDAHLYEWLVQWNWYVTGNDANGYYATREETAGGKSRSISMHSQIMGPRPGETRKMDHHDRNTMNNTGANLRYASNLQSAANRGRTRRNASGYKGVCWSKNTSKWLAQIQVCGRNYCQGYFSTKEEAARAYDRAAIKFFGEFAVLNFPREDYL